MSGKQELIDKINALIQKSPSAESISAINTARNFKEIVAETKQMQNKKEATLQDLLRQLNMFYK